MPAPGQVFRYANYARLIPPGQLILGVRRDGTARLGTWQECKVLLILGSSSSGKTTTMAEKVVGAVRGGGQIVVCDPHGHKQDSLLRKIAPLEHACLPGTTFAREHTAILHNVSAVKRELDLRVRGGSCATAVFLILEELNRLQRDQAIAKEVKEVLQILGQEGRGFHLYAIIGAQQITHLAEIRKSMISFAVHRVDESEARLCIPARFAKYAMELGVGQTFFKDADGITEPLQQVLVTAEDVQRLARTLPQRRPASTQSGRPSGPASRSSVPSVVPAAHPHTSVSLHAPLPVPHPAKPIQTEEVSSAQATTQPERVQLSQEALAQAKLDTLAAMRAQGKRSRKRSI